MTSSISAPNNSGLPKKSKLMPGAILSLAALLFCAPAAQAGETIIYPGAALDTINTRTNSLGPSGSASGKSNSLSGNDVTVENGLIGGNVLGAFNINDSTQVSTNTVTIMGGQINGYVYGGYAWDGQTTGNHTIINDGLVNNEVYGGWSYYGPSTGNTATVNGGTVRFLFGGRSWGTLAEGNTATVNGGLVERDVHGGYSTTNGLAQGNTVNINGGEVAVSVYGGVSWIGSAVGNTVNLSGGKVQGHIFGGYSNQGKTIGNVVNLSGTTLSINTDIYGGQSPSEDQFSGNTFNILKPQSVTVHSVQNFEFYRFVLPTDLAAPMLATSDLDLTDSFGAKAPKVDQIGLVGGGSAPAVGDTYTLIASTNPITQGTYTGNLVQAQKGITLVYDMEAYIEATGHNLMLKVLSVPMVKPESEALSEGHLAGLALVNQASNLVAGAGLTSALAASCQSSPNQLASFLTVGGGSSRYNTGSHVDMNSLSIMTGLSWRAPLEQDQLMVAAFFETGRGDYDSYNNFPQASAVEANGDSKYFGGGLLARYGVTDCQDTGFYGEASFRAGRTSTDFFSSDLISPDGQKASYDSSAAYYGAHAGLGYVLPLTEKSKIDLSTKYLWLRQGGDRVNVAGDPINLEASTSHRWRNGARYSHDFITEGGALWRPYVGAALDYEFDGQAGATAYGYHLPAPSLKGGTGVGEVGLSFKPSSASNLRLDLGLEGYAGKREGVSGSFRVKVEF